MRSQYPKQNFPTKWYMYATLLCGITIFAVLPLIIQDQPNLDAIWSWCTMATGACLGAYYGVHGTPWKGRRGVIPIVCVILAVCAPLIAANIFGGSSDGEMVTHLVAAAGKVLAGAMGAVLGKSLGRLCSVSNSLWEALRKERNVLFVLFAVSFAVVYVQCAVAGPFGNDNAILQYAAYILVVVTAVTGALLGTIYGSYKIRYGARLWFGVTVLALLLFAIYILPDVPLAAVWTCGDAINCPIGTCSASMDRCADPPDWLVLMYMQAVPIWALAFAGIVVIMEILGAILGAHYSARLNT